MKKCSLLSLVFAVIAVSILFGTSVHASGDFDIVDGVLMRYNGPGGHVVIPEGVTVIGRGVFSDNFDVTSVTFPSTLEVIGFDAFRHARELREIHVPSSVKEIHEGAFAFCWSLATVVIPPTIEYIGRNAFLRTRWSETTFSNYEWLGTFSHGAFLVRNGERYGLASLSGAELLPTRYEVIQALRNGYRETRQGGAWSLLDADLQPTTAVNNLYRVMTANPDDYSLESQHFILHIDPERHLVGNVSPGAYALWLEDLDTLYQLFYGFVGAAPSRGAKINFWVEYERTGSWGWGSIWGNNIWVQYRQMPGVMQDVEMHGRLGFGIPHELGHNFHHPYWTFSAEFNANLSVHYAMHMNNTYQLLNDRSFGNDHRIDRWYHEASVAFNNGTLQDFSRTSDDLHLYFTPIIRNAGWDVISAALHSYFDGSFPLQAHMNTGERDPVRLANFIDRLTYFNDGICVLSYSVDNGELLRRVYPTQRVPRTAITGTDFVANNVAEHYIVPESITRIEGRAFQDFRAMEAIVIPESVIYLGDRAFYRNVSLRHVYIFSRDVEIHGWAFFSGTDEVNLTESITLYGFPNSTVEAFARRWRINFVPLEEDATFAGISSLVAEGLAPVAEDASSRILRFAIGSTTFTINGERHTLEAAPFITSGRTMVPLRVIGEALGATDLTFRAGVISLNLHGQTITMTVGEPLPGGWGTPMIVSGRTFVPLAYIVNEMGATARWDSSARAAYIYVN